MIFNRSHYADDPVVRVHRLAPPGVWPKRYELIHNFEKQLVAANETTIVQFFLTYPEKSNWPGSSSVWTTLPGDGRSANPTI